MTSYWRRQLSWQRVIVHRVVSAAVPTSTAEQREYNIFFAFFIIIIIVEDVDRSFQAYCKPETFVWPLFREFRDLSTEGGSGKCGNREQSMVENAGA